MKQKGFVPIIILILITLVVVGYFGYKNYWPKIQTMVIPSPAASATADPTANWKTYTNTGQNFSYKCHTQWNLGKNLNYDGKVETSECTIVYSGKFSFDDGGVFTLEFVPDSIALAQTNYASTEINQVKSQSNAQIYSNNGFEGWVSMKNEAHTLQMIARKNVAGGYYEATALAVGETKTEQEYKTIFDQILSTFKFTNQTSTIPSGWKTFTIQPVNLSFAYPTNLQTPNEFSAADYTVLKGDQEYMVGVGGSDVVYLSVYLYRSSKNPSDWWNNEGKIKFEQLRTSVENAMNTNTTINFTYNTQSAILAGQNALNVIVSSNYSSPQTPPQRYLTIIQQNGYIVMTSYQDMGTTTPSIDLSKQILSTFKFTQ